METSFRHGLNYRSYTVCIVHVIYGENSFKAASCIGNNSVILFNNFDAKDVVCWVLFYWKLISKVFISDTASLMLTSHGAVYVTTFACLMLLGVQSTSHAIGTIAADQSAYTSSNGNFIALNAQ